MSRSKYKILQSFFSPMDQYLTERYSRHKVSKLFYPILFSGQKCKEIKNFSGTEENNTKKKRDEICRNERNLPENCITTKIDEANNYKRLNKNITRDCRESPSKQIKEIVVPVQNKNSDKIGCLKSRSTSDILCRKEVVVKPRSSTSLVTFGCCKEDPEGIKEAIDRILKHIKDTVEEQNCRCHLANAQKEISERKYMKKICCGNKNVSTKDKNVQELGKKSTKKVDNKMQREQKVQELIEKIKYITRSLCLQKHSETGENLSKNTYSTSNSENIENVSKKKSSEENPDRIRNRETLDEDKMAEMTKKFELGITETSSSQNEVIPEEKFTVDDETKKERVKKLTELVKVIMTKRKCICREDIMDDQSKGDINTDFEHSSGKSDESSNVSIDKLKPELSDTSLSKKSKRKVSFLDEDSQTYPTHKQRSIETDVDEYGVDVSANSIEATRSSSPSPSKDNTRDTGDGSRKKMKMVSEETYTFINKNDTSINTEDVEADKSSKTSISQGSSHKETVSSDDEFYETSEERVNKYDMESDSPREEDDDDSNTSDEEDSSDSDEEDSTDSEDDIIIFDGEKIQKSPERDSRTSTKSLFSVNPESQEKLQSVEENENVRQSSQTSTRSSARFPEDTDESDLYKSTSTLSNASKRIQSASDTRSSISKKITSDIVTIIKKEEKILSQVDIVVKKSTSGRLEDLKIDSSISSTDKNSGESKSQLHKKKLSGQKLEEKEAKTIENIFDHSKMNDRKRESSFPKKSSATESNNLGLNDNISTSQEINKELSKDRLTSERLESQVSVKRISMSSKVKIISERKLGHQKSRESSIKIISDVSDQKIIETESTTDNKQHRTQKTQVLQKRISKSEPNLSRVDSQQKEKDSSSLIISQKRENGPDKDNLGKKQISKDDSISEVREPRTAAKTERSQIEEDKKQSETNTSKQSPQNDLIKTGEKGKDGRSRREFETNKDITKKSDTLTQNELKNEDKTSKKLETHEQQLQRMQKKDESVRDSRGSKSQPKIVSKDEFGRKPISEDASASKLRETGTLTESERGRSDTRMKDEGRKEETVVDRKKADTSRDAETHANQLQRDQKKDESSKRRMESSESRARDQIAETAPKHIGKASTDEKLKPDQKTMNANERDEMKTSDRGQEALRSKKPTPVIPAKTSYETRKEHDGTDDKGKEFQKSRKENEDRENKLRKGGEPTSSDSRARDQIAGKASTDEKLKPDQKTMNGNERDEIKNSDRGQEALRSKKPTPVLPAKTSYETRKEHDTTDDKGKEFQKSRKENEDRENKLRKGGEPTSSDSRARDQIAGKASTDEKLKPDQKTMNGNERDEMKNSDRGQEALRSKKPTPVLPAKTSYETRKEHDTTDDKGKEFQKSRKENEDRENKLRKGGEPTSSDSRARDQIAGKASTDEKLKPDQKTMNGNERDEIKNSDRGQEALRSKKPTPVLPAKTSYETRKEHDTTDDKGKEFQKSRKENEDRENKLRKGGEPTSSDSRARDQIAGKASTDEKLKPDQKTMNANERDEMKTSDRGQEAIRSKTPIPAKPVKTSYETRREYDGTDGKGKDFQKSWKENEDREDKLKKGGEPTSSDSRTRDQIADKASTDEKLKSDQKTMNANERDEMKTSDRGQKAIRSKTPAPVKPVKTSYETRKEYDGTDGKGKDFQKSRKENEDREDKLKKGGEPTSSDSRARDQIAGKASTDEKLKPDQKTMNGNERDEMKTSDRGQEAIRSKTPTPAKPVKTSYETRKEYDGTDGKGKDFQKSRKENEDREDKLKKGGEPTSSDSRARDQIAGKASTDEKLKPDQKTMNGNERDEMKTSDRGQEAIRSKTPTPAKPVKTSYETRKEYDGTDGKGKDFQKSRKENEDREDKLKKGGEPTSSDSRARDQIAGKASTDEKLKPDQKTMNGNERDEMKTRDRGQEAIRSKTPTPAKPVKTSYETRKEYDGTDGKGKDFQKSRKENEDREDKLKKGGEPTSSDSRARDQIAGKASTDEKLKPDQKTMNGNERDEMKTSDRGQEAIRSKTPTPAKLVKTSYETRKEYDGTDGKGKDFQKSRKENEDREDKLKKGGDPTSSDSRARDQIAGKASTDEKLKPDQKTMNANERDEMKTSDRGQAAIRSKTPLPAKPVKTSYETRKEYDGTDGKGKDFQKSRKENEDREDKLKKGGDPTSSDSRARDQIAGKASTDEKLKPDQKTINANERDEMKTSDRGQEAIRSKTPIPAKPVKTSYETRKEYDGTDGKGKDFQKSRKENEDREDKLKKGGDPTSSDSRARDQIAGKASTDEKLKPDQKTMNANERDEMKTSDRGQKAIRSKTPIPAKPVKTSYETKEYDGTDGKGKDFQKSRKENEDREDKLKNGGDPTSSDSRARDQIAGKASTDEKLKSDQKTINATERDEIKFSDRGQEALRSEKPTPAKPVKTSYETRNEYDGKEKDFQKSRKENEDREDKLKKGGEPTSSDSRARDQIAETPPKHIGKASTDEKLKPDQKTINANERGEMQTSDRGQEALRSKKPTPVITAKTSYETRKEHDGTDGKGKEFQKSRKENEDREDKLRKGREPTSSDSRARDQIAERVPKHMDMKIKEEELKDLRKSEIEQEKKEEKFKMQEKESKFSISIEKPADGDFRTGETESKQEKKEKETASSEKAMEVKRKEEHQDKSDSRGRQPEDGDGKMEKQMKEHDPSKPPGATKMTEKQRGNIDDTQSRYGEIEASAIETGKEDEKGTPTPTKRVDKYDEKGMNENERGPEEVGKKKEKIEREGAEKPVTAKKQPINDQLDSGISKEAGEIGESTKYDEEPGPEEQPGQQKAKESEMSENAKRTEKRPSESEAQRKRRSSGDSKVSKWKSASPNSRTKYEKTMTDRSGKKRDSGDKNKIDKKGVQGYAASHITPDEKERRKSKENQPIKEHAKTSPVKLQAGDSRKRSVQFVKNKPQGIGIQRGRKVVSESTDTTSDKYPTIRKKTGIKRDRRSISDEEREKRFEKSTLSPFHQNLVSKDIEKRIEIDNQPISCEILDSTFGLSYLLDGQKTECSDEETSVLEDEERNRNQDASINPEKREKEEKEDKEDATLINEKNNIMQAPQLSNDHESSNEISALQKKMLNDATIKSSGEKPQPDVAPPIQKNDKDPSKEVPSMKNNDEQKTRVESDRKQWKSSISTDSAQKVTMKTEEKGKEDGYEQKSRGDGKVIEGVDSRTKNESRKEEEKTDRYEVPTSRESEDDPKERHISQKRDESNLKEIKVGRRVQQPTPLKENTILDGLSSTIQENEKTNSNKEVVKELKNLQQKDETSIEPLPPLPLIKEETENKKIYSSEKNESDESDNREEGHRKEESSHDKNPKEMRKNSFVDDEKDELENSTIKESGLDMHGAENEKVIKYATPTIGEKESTRTAEKTINRKENRNGRKDITKNGEHKKQESSHDKNPKDDADDFATLKNEPEHSESKEKQSRHKAGTHQNLASISKKSSSETADRIRNLKFPHTQGSVSSNKDIQEVKNGRLATNSRMISSRSSLEYQKRYSEQKERNRSISSSNIKEKDKIFSIDKTKITGHDEMAGTKPKLIEEDKEMRENRFVVDEKDELEKSTIKESGLDMHGAKNEKVIEYTNPTIGEKESTRIAEKTINRKENRNVRKDITKNGEHKKQESSHDKNPKDDADHFSTLKNVPEHPESKEKQSRHKTDTHQNLPLISKKSSSESADRIRNLKFPLTQGSVSSNKDIQEVKNGRLATNSRMISSRSSLEYQKRYSVQKERNRSISSSNIKEKDKIFSIDNTKITRHDKMAGIKPKQTEEDKEMRKNRFVVDEKDRIKESGSEEHEAENEKVIKYTNPSIGEKESTRTAEKTINRNENRNGKKDITKNGELENESSKSNDARRNKIYHSSSHRKEVYPERERNYGMASDFSEENIPETGSAKHRSERNNESKEHDKFNKKISQSGHGWEEKNEEIFKEGQSSPRGKYNGDGKEKQSRLFTTNSSDQKSPKEFETSFLSRENSQNNNEEKFNATEKRKSYKEMDSKRDQTKYRESEIGETKSSQRRNKIISLSSNDIEEKQNIISKEENLEENMDRDFDIGEEEISTTVKIDPDKRKEPGTGQTKTRKSKTLDISLQGDRSPSKSNSNIENSILIPSDTEIQTIKQRKSILSDEKDTNPKKKQKSKVKLMISKTRKKSKADKSRLHQIEIVALKFVEDILNESLEEVLNKRSSNKDEHSEIKPQQTAARLDSEQKNEMRESDEREDTNTINKIENVEENASPDKCICSRFNLVEETIDIAKFAKYADILEDISLDKALEMEEFLRNPSPIIKRRQRVKNPPAESSKYKTIDIEEAWSSSSVNTPLDLSGIKNERHEIGETKLVSCGDVFRRHQNGKERHFVPSTKEDDKNQETGRSARGPDFATEEESHEISKTCCCGDIELKKVKNICFCPSKKLCSSQAEILDDSGESKLSNCLNILSSTTERIQYEMKTFTRRYIKQDKYINVPSTASGYLRERKNVSEYNAKNESLSNIRASKLNARESNVSSRFFSACDIPIDNVLCGCPYEENAEESEDECPKVCCSRATESVITPGSTDGLSCKDLRRKLIHSFTEKNINIRRIIEGESSSDSDDNDESILNRAISIRCSVSKKLVKFEKCTSVCDPQITKNSLSINTNRSCEFHEENRNHFCNKFSTNSIYFCAGSSGFPKGTMSDPELTAQLSTANGSVREENQICEETAVLSDALLSSGEFSKYVATDCPGDVFTKNSSGSGNQRLPFMLSECSSMVHDMKTNILELPIDKLNNVVHENSLLHLNRRLSREMEMIKYERIFSSISLRPPIARNDLLNSILSLNIATSFIFEGRSFQALLDILTVSEQEILKGDESKEFKSSFLQGYKFNSNQYVIQNRTISNFKEKTEDNLSISNDVGDLAEQFPKTMLSRQPKKKGEIRRKLLDRYEKQRALLSRKTGKRKGKVHSDVKTIKEHSSSIDYVSSQGTLGDFSLRESSSFYSNKSIGSTSEICRKIGPKETKENDTTAVGADDVQKEKEPVVKISTNPYGADQLMYRVSIETSKEHTKTKKEPKQKLSCKEATKRICNWLKSFGVKTNEVEVVKKKDSEPFCNAEENLMKQRKVLRSKLRYPKSKTSKLYLNKKEYDQMQQETHAHEVKASIDPVLREIPSSELIEPDYNDEEQESSSEEEDLWEQPKEKEKDDRLIVFSEDSMVLFERKKVYDRLQQYGKLFYTIYVDDQDEFDHVSIRSAESVERRVECEDRPFYAHYDLGPNDLRVHVTKDTFLDRKRDALFKDENFVECQNSQVKLSLMRGKRYLNDLDPTKAKIIEIDCTNQFSEIKICYNKTVRSEQCVCEDPNVCKAVQLESSELSSLDVNMKDKSQGTHELCKDCRECQEKPETCENYEDCLKKAVCSSKKKITIVEKSTESVNTVQFCSVRQNFRLPKEDFGEDSEETDTSSDKLYSSSRDKVPKHFRKRYKNIKRRIYHRKER